MRLGSRAVGELLVRALARLGLALSLTVLAAVFMSTAASGDDRSAPALGTTAASTGGVVLALTVLGLGMTVLAVGATHPRRPALRRVHLNLDPSLDPLPVGWADEATAARPAAS